MAAPIAPNATSIIAEALKKAGISVPSAVQNTRAAQWLEEVKRDITRQAGGRYLRSLYSTAYSVTTIGRSKYALPAAFLGKLSITILDGVHTGTAQTAATGSITLAANEDIGSGIVGSYILITSGTGINEYVQCTAYNETTKVATITPNFTVTPIAGDGYMVVDTFYPLDPQTTITKLDNQSAAVTITTPLAYAYTGNSTTGDYVLWPPPDKVYGVQLRYYTNLQTLDLAGTLLGTFYLNFYDIFEKGVFVRQLQDNDDKRYPMEEQLYRMMLRRAINDEIDDNWLSDDFINPAYEK